MSFTVADPIYYNKPVYRFGFLRPRNMDTKKNLLDHYIEEDSINPSEDAIKVFLRLKPTLIESNVIQVLDAKTILFKMPQEFMQARNKLNMPDHYKYSFSHIYEPNTTQSQIYTGCVAPLIKNLFNGQHCLLFTYGTTNAGKTFTVLGNGDNPGIIPRTLTTVFKSICGKEYKNDQIMPDKFNSAIEVTESTLAAERKFKEEILTWSHRTTQMDSKLHKTNSTVRSSVDEIFGESVFREMQKRLTNDTSIVEYASESDDRFSVWVSFAEIYNEAIYDLLQPVTPNFKRKQLKLGQDNHKNYYIKGLKHVFVESEEEAYKVLMFGKTNLQVAATGMNTRSSRSHCIFNIKLIKSPNVEHPERVVVSSFAICDLAGAERQKKTLNVGLRLKESQNINCSLHVLSRCFTIIRENQMNMESKMIPFRDSKLTQLFKHALTGKESVTMIVNVNSDYQLCEETQHVLKASAIAKHIVVQQRKPKQHKRDIRQSVFSQIVKHNRSTLIRWDSCVKPKANELMQEDIIEEQNKNEREQKQEQYENLLSLVEELKDKLKEEKLKHNETKKNWKAKEEEIRQEVKRELTEYLEKAKEQENLDNKRTEATKQEINKDMKRRLHSPEECVEIKKPKPNQAELDQSFEIQDLQGEVKLQQKQIDGLTDLINILKEEKKELGMELALARLNLSHRERDITNLKAKIEMLGEKSSLHEKFLSLEKEMEEKIMLRDQLLNEAKEDWLTEVQAKEDLEEEIAKLEKELSDKEEDMLNQMEALKENISDKEDQIDLLEARIENMEYMHEDEVKEYKTKCTTLEEEIARLCKLGKTSLSDDMKIDFERQILELTVLKEDLESAKLTLEQQLAKLTEENIDLVKIHRNEIQDLKIKCATLEEEILCLRKVEKDSTTESSKSNLENQLSKLKTQNEALLCEKLSLEEQLARQTEGFKAFRQETAERLQTLEKQHEENMTELSAREEKIVKLNREIKTHLENLECIEVKLIERIKEADCYKLCIEENQKEFDLVRNKLESEITELVKKSAEQTELSVKSNELKSKFQSLSEALAKKSEEIENLQKNIESLNIDKKKVEEELRSEISTLEESCKKQLQETTRLWNSQRVQEIENEKLAKELSKVKNIMGDLSRSLKSKEHELECCRNQMLGYERMVPTLQSEFEVQRKELLEYKKRCEDQKETIINMERELDSFQVNQKEIMGKYEENLKKTREENDSLKKEVARVTTTFYKSTPTPKKILEKEIEEQKAQIHDLQRQLEDKEAYCERLLKENECLCSQIGQIQTAMDGANKENDSVFCAKGAKPKTKTSKLAMELDVRRRTQSCVGESNNISDSLDGNKSKSASKARTRKTTRAATIVPAILVSEAGNSKADNKTTDTKKQYRRKLWDATLNNEEQQFDDDERLTIPEDSPHTYYKRTLRTRNK
ncbi:kinesin-like protein KIF20A isoform X1 [Macrosteles quadrilineatus]|uniref:kinesin-like protein KIF20A isoform X1 n=1 Tax=Macrosteles quadrilineatus TaxID=74068 RepID=UPI0023E14E59|nr:kinesin-like protein KIF20A isoform X1 [Macrosteles quadrilineatus]